MAAKGALLGFTRGSATELGRDGFTVNLVAPDWIPVERHGVVPAEVEEQWLHRRPVPTGALRTTSPARCPTLCRGAADVPAIRPLSSY